MTNGGELLEVVEVEPKGSAEAAVVWLHGLGADGHDFEPIVPALGLDDLPVRFVFPHAPRRPVTINMGAVMRAWYDVESLELDQEQDAAGIHDSAAHVERLLAHEKARGIPASRIVLAGFSQGGAIAYHTGLRHAERLAGILVMSAYLPLAPTLEAEAAPANRETPILQCHGTHDPMVPAFLGEQSMTALRGHGYAVDWRTYPCEHSVHPREVADVGAWLRQVLEAQSV